MDYASAFASDAPESTLTAVFTEPFDKSRFALALGDAVAPSWARPTQNTTVARLFCHGARRFAAILAGAEPMASGSQQPSSHAQRVAALLSEEDITSSGRFDAQRPTAEKPTPLLDEEDIADLGARGARPHDTLPQNTAYTSPGGAAAATEPGSAASPAAAISAVTASISEASLQDAAGGGGVDVDAAVSRVAAVFQTFFTQLCVLSQKKQEDVFPVVFGVPAENDPESAEHHLLVMLQHTRRYIDGALAANDVARAGSLKELILLMHEMVRALVTALALESQGSNSALIVKRLLFTFFAADLSQTLLRLLAATTDYRPFQSAEQSGELPHDADAAEPAAAPAPGLRLRLSYETFLNTQSVLAVLAMCPADTILVSRVSLSLDITARQDSPNVYATAVQDEDFSCEEKWLAYQTTAVPFLAAQFNYYYSLHPDLMLHSLTHASFFSWLLANKFSAASYLATETDSTVTAFPTTKADAWDPFVAGTELYEYTKKRQLVSGNTESGFAVHSPTFLLNTLVLLLHTRNAGFVGAFCDSNDADMDMLAAWLCVASYISQYQYRTHYNRFSTRLALLVMLRLTSGRHPYVARLRRRPCNENVWKLCHHKTPLIPIYNNDGKKATLLYMVNVLQSSLRYNLSKKFDVENAKLVFSVLHQIVAHYETHPSDELSVFAWGELYKDVVQFLVFACKNFNDEAVKNVVEEIFAVLNLLLSPAFDRVFVKDSSFLFGSHLAKSINYDLLYIMLQQYEPLKAIFDKYIVRRGNFARVDRAFAAFADFYTSRTKEVDAADVAAFLTKLSVLSDEKEDGAAVDPKGFNYADTFKYLDPQNEPPAFANPHELLDIFKLILDYRWTKSYS